MYKIIGGDKKEYGPVTLEQLRAWVAEGRVNPQTAVLADGMTDWKPLSEFPEFAAHATAYVPPEKPPGSIKVFGIINIVFGSLGLLCSPFSLIGMPVMLKKFSGMPLMHSWLYVSTVLSFFGAAVLLASGIGLCQRKSWGRKLAVYYAVFAIVVGIIGMVIVVMSFSSSGSIDTPERIGGIIGGVIGGALGVTYYALLIIFLGRAKVKLALGEPV